MHCEDGQRKSMRGLRQYRISPHRTQRSEQGRAGEQRASPFDNLFGNTRMVIPSDHFLGLVHKEPWNRSLQSRSTTPTPTLSLLSGAHVFLSAAGWLNSISSPKCSIPLPALANFGLPSSGPRSLTGASRIVRGQHYDPR